MSRLRDALATAWFLVNVVLMVIVLVIGSPILISDTSKSDSDENLKSLSAWVWCIAALASISLYTLIYTTLNIFTFVRRKRWPAAICLIVSMLIELWGIICYLIIQYTPELHSYYYEEHRELIDLFRVLHVVYAIWIVLQIITTVGLNAIAPPTVSHHGNV